MLRQSLISIAVMVVFMTSVLAYPMINFEYHNYDELTEVLETLHQMHPDICDLYSIGQSVDGKFELDGNQVSYAIPWVKTYDTSYTCVNDFHFMLVTVSHLIWGELPDWLTMRRENQLKKYCSFHLHMIYQRWSFRPLSLAYFAEQPELFNMISIA